MGLTEELQNHRCAIDPPITLVVQLTFIYTIVDTVWARPNADEMVMLVWPSGLH